MLAQRLQVAPVTEKDLEELRAKAAAVAASQQRKLAGPIRKAHELAQELGVRPPVFFQKNFPSRPPGR
ncbi:MAG: hypothetical protein AB7S38_01555 [Vulcanimicrobiota bacterium]